MVVGFAVVVVVVVVGIAVVVAVVVVVTFSAVVVVTEELTLSPPDSPTGTSAQDTERMIQQITVNQTRAFLNRFISILLFIFSYTLSKEYFQFRRW